MDSYLLLRDSRENGVNDVILVILAVWKKEERCENQIFYAGFAS